MARTAPNNPNTTPNTRGMGRWPARGFTGLAALVAIALTWACANQSISKVRGSQVVGQASWYGGSYHGRQTASGERFDKHALTAAHRELPFGTKLLVTHVGNGKSVTVRINDRGPFGRRGRIIDLSEAAAVAIGMKNSGVAKVRLKVLSLPPPKKKKRRKSRRK